MSAKTIGYLYGLFHLHSRGFSILDESFINWVKKKDAVDMAFWDDWIVLHPEQRETVVTAVKFLIRLQLKDNVITDAEAAESWQLVDAAIQPRKLKIKHDLATEKARPLIQNWQRIAAVFAGFLLISTALFFFLRDKKATLTTSYGETKSIVLPDSSIIILNANSSLTYANEWNSRQSREVWLEGEAFLQVVKKPGAGNARFVVHTKGVDVEVLGTSFNVNSRHQKTKVVLNSGKVQLTSEESSRKKILMEPGELVEFSELAQSFTKKKVNPELYTAWRNGKLIFNDISVVEVAQLLEDNYGLQVIVADKALQSRKITGEIASTDEETVLEVLSESLHIAVQKQGRTVTLQNK